LDVSGHSGLPPEVQQWEVEIRRPIWAKVSKTLISTNKAGMCAVIPVIWKAEIGGLGQKLALSKNARFQLKNI
jgi:hypothetical protein